MQSDDSTESVDVAAKRPWLTVEQLCKIKQITPRTFRNLRDAGFGPRIVRLGTARNAPIRITPEDDDAWTERLCALAESEAAATARIFDFPPKANGGRDA